MAYYEEGGLKLYYDCKGNPDQEETVVFLNGLMASAEHWSHQTGFLEKFGFRILVMDFKGQLMSDFPEEGDYHPRTQAEHLFDLLNHLYIKKIHIVGTSYGAMVGMFFNALYPGNVKSFTLIDATSTPNDKMLRLKLKSWKDLILNGDYRGYYQSMLTHVYSKNYIEKNYDKLMESMEVVLKLPDRYFKGIVSLMDGLLNNDLKELTEYPSKIQCPALVIRGEEDGFTPRYMSDRIAEQIPHAEYAIIPDAGHVLIFEKYSSLNSILLGFLRKHYQKNEF